MGAEVPKWIRNTSSVQRTAKYQNLKELEGGEIKESLESQTQWLEEAPRNYYCMNGSSVILRMKASETVAPKRRRERSKGTNVPCDGVDSSTQYQVTAEHTTLKSKNKLQICWSPQGSVTRAISSDRWHGGRKQRKWDKAFHHLGLLQGWPLTPESSSRQLCQVPSAPGTSAHDHIHIQATLERSSVWN